MDFRGKIDPVNLCKACKKCNIKRILSFSSGILADHLAKTDFHIFLTLDDLLHIKRKISTVIRVLVHIFLCLFQFLMGSIFRWDKYADQFIHHITVVFFMLHREQIHLVLNRT